MRSEPISLLPAVVLLLCLAASGAEESHTEKGMVPTAMKAKDNEGEVKDPQEEEFTMCVEDVFSADTIALKEEPAGALGRIQTALSELPLQPPIEEITTLLGRLPDLFQIHNLGQVSRGLRNVLNDTQTIVRGFMQQWLGYFDNRRREAMQDVRRVVDSTNSQISEFFNNHLEEFKDVCLPDTNKCLESIHRNLDTYSGKVNQNMEACERFKNRQLDQHQQLVNNAKKLLERPFLAIRDCFRSGQLISSLVSCVGNLMGNVFKTITDGVTTFSGAMQSASNSLTDRLGKFEQCVVERKKLLDDGQRAIAEKAAKCLEKARDQQKSNLFAE